jgi:hypothetical protein
MRDSTIEKLQEALSTDDQFKEFVKDNAYGLNFSESAELIQAMTRAVCAREEEGTRGLARPFVYYLRAELPEIPHSPTAFEAEEIFAAEGQQKSR